RRKPRRYGGGHGGGDIQIIESARKECAPKVLPDGGPVVRGLAGRYVPSGSGPAGRARRGTLLHLAIRIEDQVAPTYMWFACHAAGGVVSAATTQYKSVGLAKSIRQQCGFVPPVERIPTAVQAPDGCTDL